jgi:hypothetical protein
MNMKAMTKAQMKGLLWRIWIEVEQMTGEFM